MLNDEYENFITANIKATTKYIPTKPKTNVEFPESQYHLGKNEITSKSVFT